jgi:hypothetical protein
MADPLRTDTPRPADAGDAADRQTKIEDLLLGGLDRYFSGDYEQAINVWTRVLFLDRSHARARAYIERARRALAERLRESEELVHRGVAAFNRGDGLEARDLLQLAIVHGGPQDVALSFLERLDRLEGTASPGAGAAPEPQAEPSAFDPVDPGPAAEPVGRRPVRALPLLLFGAMAVGLVVAAASWDILRPMFQFDLQWRPAAAPVAVTPQEPLPIPRPAELWLSKAQALVGTGHLQEALRALEPVRPSDPLYPEAERLRAAIQRALLNGTGVALSAPSPPPTATASPDTARE